jgi:hypothetical protein
MSGQPDGGRKRAGSRRVHARLGRVRTAGRRTAGLLSTVTVAAAVALVPAAGTAHGGTPRGARTDATPARGIADSAPARGASATAGPFVTLLFSRTEISAADNCVQDDADVARLDTTVAPFLHTFGIAGTGTLVTDRTYATRRNCIHYNDDLSASWADATNLARKYGWSFVSHTATYPGVQKIERMTPAEQYAATCGTIATITSHGLPGAAGMIAYPGSGPVSKSAAVEKLQSQYGAKCFDWGRQYVGGVYGNHGVTKAIAASTPPYWQATGAVVGGACHVRTAPCYNLHIKGNERYRLPSEVIARIRALKPGQWFTLQAYLLVTGTNPKYAKNYTKWDCTSPNPALHWTNAQVRYCWSDYQRIIRAIAADPSITVTDPATVGKAWGRPFGG